VIAGDAVDGLFHEGDHSRTSTLVSLLNDMSIHRSEEILFSVMLLRVLMNEACVSELRLLYDRRSATVGLADWRAWRHSTQRTRVRQGWVHCPLQPLYSTPVILLRRLRL
jgi:hypothetical protein